ncbi:hypothetical protein LJR220_004381 [Bradyrhizobium sp. LjRoot220]
MIFRHLDTAKPQDWPRLVALAKSADLVRGYGHIKEANVARYRQECARLEGPWDNRSHRPRNRFPATGRGFFCGRRS